MLWLRPHLISFIQGSKSVEKEDDATPARQRAGRPGRRHADVIDKDSLRRRCKIA